MSIVIQGFYGASAGSGEGGVTDHGALTGRADDDHPQYYNQTRGDARYAALGHGHDELALAATAIQPGLSSYFAKAIQNAVAWSVTGANALQTAMALYVEVNGLIHIVASGTSITAPASPVTGTDYAIWCHPDGTLEATDSHVSPPIANARKLGGYHYAPGGNATAQAGGNTTPAINPYSCWDLEWRPACLDPRGMTLVANHFWSDIYFTNTATDTNGTSRFGVTIADGSSPPKIPSALGGDGTATYGSLTWFEATSLLAAYGKRAPTYPEFMALAFGVTEATSFGSIPANTALDAPRTSRWGVIQATGNMWIWGADLGGPYNTVGNWQANTEDKGWTYGLPDAALLGGSGDHGAGAGSRGAGFNNAPTLSSGVIAMRGVAAHTWR